MQTIKRKTAAEAAKEKAQRTHELVLAMIEWSENEHFEFVVDKAADYLQKQCGPDVIGQERLLAQPEFWMWWKNHWNRRDADFVEQCLGETNLKDLRAYYKHIHSSDRLQSIRPHRSMLQKSFAKVVLPVLEREVAR
jgi:hypothetical protein